ncbi:MAG: YkgJ family cysteine cluster protein [Desulfohalobiaceae bacterium]
MSSSVTSCARCGTCCSKGGPGLHVQDVELYASGSLTKDDLLTLRKGERVRDNVRGGVIDLDHEVVRVRSNAGSSACCFYDPVEKGCAIYAQRPLECRVLKCWEPAGLMSMYDRDRVGRLELIPGGSALGELILEHEQHCGILEVRELVTGATSGLEKALKGLADMLRFDASLRRGLQDRTGASDQVLEFLFGRPLPRILPVYGLRATQQDGKLTITPVHGRYG